MEQYADLRVRLTPKGGRNALTHYGGGLLHARVSAPPVDGAANRALIKLLSDVLRIARSRIAVTAGHTSRDKTVRIEGVEPAEIQERLDRALVESLSGRART